MLLPYSVPGLPRLSRLKLPSRNWLIFLTVTGTWASALAYDRYHKRRIQKKWCNFVAHLADETLSNDTMPRKITVLLEAPPGDGLRPAREHFHEYIKPILVAGALDWEVVEGRREGEIRAGLAEKIRKQRERNGEEKNKNGEDVQGENDAVLDVRQRTGISEWKGVQGDLVLGRHTWKEYIRGLHEGWLGPMTTPEMSSSPDPAPPEDPPPTEGQTSPETDSPPGEDEKPKGDAKDSSKKPSAPTPPYISTSSYSTASPAPTLPPTFYPSTPLPLPHLLGLKHTPTRIYRFLTRRHLAESTGAQVAALVLATHDRPYERIDTFSSAIDPDKASSSAQAPEGVVVSSGSTWEQENILKDEEAGWHKIAFAPLKEAEEQRERTWIEGMVIDERIGTRMRTFELEEGAQARAESMEEDRRTRKPSIIENIKQFVGWEKTERRGWEMGEEGDENS